MNKQSESVINIVGALLATQKEMKKVMKDSKNPFFKSNYADINALMEEAIPKLNENNIVVLQGPSTDNGVNYIQTTLYHTSGEYITSMNEVVTKKQNDPQDFLAAQTYTRRGALQAFLCMGAVDDDGNKINGRDVKAEAVSPAKKTFGKSAEKDTTVKVEQSVSEPAADTSTKATRSFRRTVK